MQSYLQYRRLASTVHSQLRGSPASHQNDTTTVEKETGLTPDRLEKAHTNDSQTRRINAENSESNTDSPVKHDHTGESAQTTLAQSIAGVNVQKQLETNNQPAHLFIVGWQDENDPQNPRNYPYSSRLIATLLVSALGWVVGAASSINSGVLPQTTEAFGVSDVVGSLDTGNYPLPSFTFYQFAHNTSTQ